MTLRRLTIAVVLISPIIFFLAIYIGLIKDGTLPAPDIDEIGHSIGLGTATAAQTALVVGLSLVVIMAVLAPIIYAIRSNDLITILISFVMTGGAIAALVLSRTVIDQISALIIYLANMTLSAVVYAAQRISPKGR